MAKEHLPQIPLNRLQVGLTVKLPLSWQDNPFWINRITLSSALQIEMIRGLGCQFVYLIAGEPLAEPDFTEDSNRDNHHLLVPHSHSQQFQTRKAIRLSQQRFLHAVNDTRMTYSLLGHDPQGAIKLAEQLALEMIDHLQEHPTAKLALVDLGDSQISVTQHSSSVAVLALSIGRALNLPIDDLKCLALGSLFHDIGLLTLPDSLRASLFSLSDDERKLMKLHTRFSHELVDSPARFDERVCDIARHHHECIDGSGYPDGLQGNDIPLLTQIVALADEYDHQIGGDNMGSPQDALGHLSNHSAGKHANELMQTLESVLGQYPPGTLVRLSDGSIGKVLMTSANVETPAVWGCEIDGTDAGLKFLASANLRIEEVIKLESLTENAIKALKADAAISYYFTAAVK
ncbi:HD-GYP domain-containing protein [Shewanella sp. SNU WT4]|uniref:HD-GYP domain-containing protein n=1 Tax=Shewanella sp. SNU WT4 TaxID=2590015 RepID=UPI00143E0A01|nr:HD-GYP domain-containing protein [Shewanella sp. SNU WT4]